VLLEGVLRVDAPDGGEVLLHVPTGTYLKLDRSASLIVGLLAETGTATGAAGRLAELAQIPLPRAETDVRSVAAALERLRRQSSRRPRRPGVRTSLREISAWWALPFRLRWAVVRVVTVLCVVEVGLRFMDIQRLSSFLRTPLGNSNGAAAPGGGAAAPGGGAAAPGGGERPAVTAGDPGHLRASERRTLVAIEWVGKRWINPVTCLRRALLTGYFLRRRRPTLRLGLMADGVTAHAWIEAEGVGWGWEDVSGVFEPVR
jgi:Transglutaminase-like superfamily